MIELIINYLQKYRIYLQIEEFLEDKMRFYGMNQYRIVLREFANFCKKSSLKNITIEDIQRWRQWLNTRYRTTREVQEAITKVRWFFRFWHVRKAVHVHPSQIIY